MGNVTSTEVFGMGVIALATFLFYDYGHSIAPQVQRDGTFDDPIGKDPDPGINKYLNDLQKKEFTTGFTKQYDAERRYIRNQVPI